MPGQGLDVQVEHAGDLDAMAMGTDLDLHGHPLDRLLGRDAGFGVVDPGAEDAPRQAGQGPGLLAGGLLWHVHVGEVEVPDGVDQALPLGALRDDDDAQAVEVHRAVVPLLDVQDRRVLAVTEGRLLGQLARTEDPALARVGEGAPDRPGALGRRLRVAGDRQDEGGQGGQGQDGDGELAHG